MDDFNGAIDDGNRTHASKWGRKNSASVAEIGPLPEVVNPERKEACRHDLLLFLTTYFPNSTGLKPFSEDHKRMISSLQRCIIHGGRMIRAVYRGFAKTTIGENAVLWASLYGHRELIPLVGADKDAADNNLDSIKSELEANDLLLEDFPEACFPIRALEGKSQRAGSQTQNGRLTNIEFSANQIVFPYIPGHDCAGVCIRPTSIESYNRGMKHKMPDGRQVRPEFVFVDDPQTDASAATPAQVQKRLNKLFRTILKSAGHTADMAVYVAATVIEKDDLVEQLLDPKKHPEWDGERVPMVQSWSRVHDTMWLEEYAKIRHGWDRSNPDDRRRARREATQYYYQNREKMDDGCVVSWDHCYNDGDGDDMEISSVHHAYNMLIDDGPDVFAAECQNQPAGRVSNTADMIEADDVLARATGPERGVVPSWATKLTAFIDVQGEMLWWMVCAFADDFTSCVVDYGAWPEQKRSYYTKSDIRKKLSQKYPDAGYEGRIRSGIDDLSGYLLSERWESESGKGMPVDLLMVDEGHMTPLVYEACTRSPHGSRIIPAKGKSIGVGGKPFEEYQQKTGETLGLHWRKARSGTKRVMHVVHNPNFWKRFLWSRLQDTVGDPGAMVLFKADAHDHRMLSDHLAASEYPDVQYSKARDQEVEVWSAYPNRDNDLLDCAVGCLVAASICGCRLKAVQGKRPKRKRRKTGVYA